MKPIQENIAAAIATLVAELTAAAPSWHAAWRADVAEWAAYTVLFCPRYEIDYQLYWRGNARRVNAPWSFESDATLRELCEEPNGCDAERLGDELHNWTRDFVRERIVEHVSSRVEALGIDISAYADETIDYAILYFDEEHGERIADFENDVTCEWIIDAYKWPLSGVMRDGDADAREQRKVDDAEVEARRIEAARVKARSEVVLAELLHAYEAKHGPLHLKRNRGIDKGDPRWKPLFWLIVGFSEDDRKALALSLPCSNSIRGWLARGGPSEGRFRWGS